MTSYLADCMPVYNSSGLGGTSGTRVLIGASPILRMGDAAKIGSVYLPQSWRKDITELPARL